MTDSGDIHTHLTEFVVSQKASPRSYTSPDFRGLRHSSQRVWGILWGMGAPLSKDGYEEVQRWDDDGEGSSMRVTSRPSRHGRHVSRGARKRGDGARWLVGEARNQQALRSPLLVHGVQPRDESHLCRVRGASRSSSSAAAALATTLGNVTGNSIMVGLASAVSTLGGQAFGAGSYPTLGFVLQRQIILTLAAVPISLAWWCSEGILGILGQEHDLAKRARRHPALIPGLFFYA